MVFANYVCLLKCKYFSFLTVRRANFPIYKYILQIDIVLHMSALRIWMRVLVPSLKLIDLVSMYLFYSILYTRDPTLFLLFVQGGGGQFKIIIHIWVITGCFVNIWFKYTAAWIEVRMNIYIFIDCSIEIQKGTEYIISDIL